MTLSILRSRGWLPVVIRPTNKPTVVLYGPRGLEVHLDRNQVFPENPGKGAPIRVYDPCYEAEGTIRFARGEEVLLDRRGNEVCLTHLQLLWLREVEGPAMDWVGLR